MYSVFDWNRHWGLGIEHLLECKRGIHYQVHLQWSQLAHEHVSNDQLIISQSLNTTPLIDSDLSVLAINRSENPIRLPNSLKSRCKGTIEGLSLDKPNSSIHRTPRIIKAKSTLLWTCSKSRPSKSAPVTLNIHWDGNPEEEWRIVGSLPQFGGWNPDKGVQMIWLNDHWQATVSTSLGQVAAVKMVQIIDGNPKWESGDNRFIWFHEDKDLWMR